MRIMQGLASDDPRLLPAYTLGEASRYLRIPEQTLRSWVLGRSYPTGKGMKRSLPPLSIAAPRPPMLSFVNIVEAHVLASITRDYEVPLQRVRRGILFLQRALSSRHPLIERPLETDRRDLFIREAGELINVTQDGQSAIADVLDMYLSRVEWDVAGVASQLYPFTGKAEPDAPRAVVIDPAVAFGKPVLAGTSVPTIVIAERFKAGESLTALAEDYGRRPAEIQEAIRCELEIAA